MKTFNTFGIILSRTNYGEADRILTMLTPDHGKLRLVARGVRKVKSKLAGGIELFSVSQISFIKGRGELGTLVSTRLAKHYDGIVKDLSRTMAAYDLIKQLNKATEDEPGSEYFELLQHTFAALDDKNISLDLIGAWFAMQLLSLAGHTPNLTTDTAGNKLQEDEKYSFDADAMTFVVSPSGRYGSSQIKLLRLGFSSRQPKALQKITDIDGLVGDLTPLVQTMLKTYIRI